VRVWDAPGHLDRAQLEDVTGAQLAAERGHHPPSGRQNEQYATSARPATLA
jgi:hypothetical protein